MLRVRWLSSSVAAASSLPPLNAWKASGGPTWALAGRWNAATPPSPPPTATPSATSWPTSTPASPAPRTAALPPAHAGQPPRRHRRLPGQEPAGAAMSRKIDLPAEAHVRAVLADMLAEAAVGGAGPGGPLPGRTRPSRPGHPGHG